MPVLSEQIADTEPSVSTEGRRLTMAFCEASTLRPGGVQGGDDGRQAGRDRRDGERHAGDEQVVEVLVVGETEQDHDDERHAGQAGDDHGEAVELLLQRRLVGLGLVEQVGDAADLGVHPRAGHDELASAAGDGRVHEHHAQSVAERDVVAIDRRDVLEDRRALTGEGGLFDLERGGQEQPPVGGDAVAGLDQHDVAGDELGGVDLDDRAVAAHAGDVLQHLLQRGEAGFGLGLLSEAQHGVEDGQPDQHDRRAGLTGHDLVHDRRDRPG